MTDPAAKEIDELVSCLRDEIGNLDSEAEERQLAGDIVHAANTWQWGTARYIERAIALIQQLRQPRETGGEP